MAVRLSHLIVEDLRLLRPLGSSVALSLGQCSSARVDVVARSSYVCTARHSPRSSGGSTIFTSSFASGSAAKRHRTSRGCHVLILFSHCTLSRARRRRQSSTAGLPSERHRRGLSYPSGGRGGACIRDAHFRALLPASEKS